MEQHFRSETMRWPVLAVLEADWTEEYQRASTQCRLLGERIRRDPTGREPTGPGGGVLARLAFRLGAEVPPAGKAA